MTDSVSSVEATGRSSAKLSTLPSSSSLDESRSIDEVSIPPVRFKVHLFYTIYIKFTIGSIVTTHDYKIK